MLPDLDSLRGRAVDRPRDPEVRRYLFRVKVKDFVEAHVARAGIDLLFYRAMELGNISFDHKTRTAKSAAVKAASKKFSKGQRWIYDLIKPNPDLEKYYHEYREYRAREAAVEALLRKYYSVDECARLYSLVSNRSFESFEFLEKLARERAELEDLRALFHKSLSDADAWKKIRDAIARALGESYRPRK